MAARRPTLFQQAQKEIKRIKKAAERISKRGYEFNIPFLKPKKRYTRKDVEKLTGIKAKDLYKYATAYGMRGERYREIERSRAAQKGAETREGLRKPFDFGDVERYKEEILEAKRQREKQELVSISQSIISNFLSRKEFLPEPKFTDIGYEIVQDFINNMIENFGVDAVAQAIQLGSLDGSVQEVHASYDSNVVVNLNRLRKLMPDNLSENMSIKNFSSLLDDDSFGYNNSDDKDTDIIEWW